MSSTDLAESVADYKAKHVPDLTMCSFSAAERAAWLLLPCPDHGNAVRFQRLRAEIQAAMDQGYLEGRRASARAKLPRGLVDPVEQGAL